MRPRTLCLLFAGADIQTFIILTAAVSSALCPTASLFTSPSVKSCLALGSKTQDPVHSFLPVFSWQENPSWFISSGDESWWDKIDLSWPWGAESSQLHQQNMIICFKNVRFICLHNTEQVYAVSWLQIKQQHNDMIKGYLFLLPLIVNS